MNRKTIIAILLLAFSFAAPARLNAEGPHTNPPAPQRLRNLIWRDPGDVARLNLSFAEGGPNAAPKPPFTFVKEDTGGTNPKIDVDPHTFAAKAATAGHTVRVMRPRETIAI